MRQTDHRLLRGRCLDTVVPEKTGLFFKEQRIGALMEAIERFHRYDWDPAYIRAHAEQFGEHVFMARLRSSIEELVLEKTSREMTMEAKGATDDAYHFVVRRKRKSIVAFIERHPVQAVSENFGMRVGPAGVDGAARLGPTGTKESPGAFRFGDREEPGGTDPEPAWTRGGVDC